MPQKSDDPDHCFLEAARLARMAALSPFEKDRKQFLAMADAWIKRGKESSPQAPQED